MTATSDGKGVTARVYGCARLFSVGLLAIGASWSYLAISSSLAVDEFIAVAGSPSGEAESMTPVSGNLQRLRQAVPTGWACPPEAHQWAASFLIEAAQKPEVSAADRLRILGEARIEISEAIACRREDGNLWLLMAQLEMLPANSNGAIIALATSFDLAPNDGFVLVRRLLLTASLGLPIDERLRASTWHDLEMLINVRPIQKNALLYALDARTSAEVESWFVENLGLIPPEPQESDSGAMTPEAPTHRNVQL